MATPPADRKAWEQQQRRNRIVDMAEAVFLRDGYEKAALPAIAEAAGYNRRTLYLYFKDREAIFQAVVLRSLTRLLTALEAAARDAHAQPDCLRRLAEAFFDFAIDNPGDLDLIMAYESRYFVYHGRAAAPEPDGCLAQCQQVSNDMAQLVTAAIEAGMAAGAISTDLNPHQLMLILWGQIFGVIKVLNMRRKNFTAAFGIDRRTLFDHFVGMVERSLAK